MLDQITPVILTRDEAPNIARTLGQLGWAREIIVVDSGSTDQTLAIVEHHENARIVHRTLDDLAAQWTFAVEQASTPWVLTLDADYFVPEAAVREMATIDPGYAAAFEAIFLYAVEGRPLRASLYPPRAVLLRRDACSFFMDGHTQRVRVDGRIARLSNALIHDDRKSFGSFVARQRRYMRDEARKLRGTPFRTLPLPGKIRRMVVIAPLAVLVHTLFVKRLLLDGWPGIRYAIERTIAETVLSVELLRG
jgi:glycosyltransferase involved in cell wall biosynthesis